MVVVVGAAGWLDAAPWSFGWDAPPFDSLGPGCSGVGVRVPGVPDGARNSGGSRLGGIVIPGGSGRRGRLVCPLCGGVVVGVLGRADNVSVVGDGVVGGS